MEPTLKKGWTVWVDGDADHVSPGDVVILEGGCGWIVHRIIWRSILGETDLLFHRGDFEGGIGVSPWAAIRGRVVAIIEPDRAPIPPFSSLPTGFRRRFRWAQARCRVYSLCRSAALYLSLDQGREFRAVRRVFRKMLL